ncbi:MAG: hypothetical protein ABI629_00645 [bacterium]
MRQRTAKRSGWRAVARVGVLVGGVALAGAGTLYAAGHHHPALVREPLTATSAAPEARGKVQLLVKSSRQAKLKIATSKLAGGKTYDLLVGGVKVGVIATSNGGSGRASFSAVPRSRAALLGFDPRGDQMTVRDQEDGEDVLVGDIPSDDPTAVACCLTEKGDDNEVECEDLTADECAAAGGTTQAVDSCLPNPCATNPLAGGELVCCTNATHDDESESECEDIASKDECAGLGGTLVQATSCDDDPCNGAAPVDRTACCVPDDDGGGEIDGAVLSSAACEAHGGIAVGTGTAAASCSADPCGGGGGDDGDGGDDS